MLTKHTLSALVSIACILPLRAAYAQQPAWAQCGGIGWSGATTCVSGWTCTVSNPYYSQCLQGTAAPTSTSSTVGGSAPTGTPPSNQKVNYWFSFGDSYTQTGFVTDGTLPAVGNPLGNPPYPGYTAVGGVNWIDLMTVTNNNSLILTYNYAYGGATIDASLVAPYEPTVLSLTDQVNEFLTTAAQKPASTPWTSANSLFSIFIGINDLGNSYYQSGDRAAFSDTLLNAEFALVQKLYTAGARNFLFVNVPPTDRSPLMIPQGTSACALLKSVIQTHNSKYIAKIAQFKANNTDVKTWLWDSNTDFGTILDSPQKYGFVDATSYGNTGDFWGNNLHPAAPANVIFAQQISDHVLNGTVW